MNSAELPVRFRTSTESSPWENVRRIYRRICLLRVSGREDAATALEHGELAAALSAARIAADGEIDEAALLAQENDRVADATVMADLITPLLAERLRAELASLTLRGPVVATAPAPAAPDPPPAPARSAGETVPGIADLIDGMLSQQSKTPPPRSR